MSDSSPSNLKKSDHAKIRKLLLADDLEACSQAIFLLEASGNMTADRVGRLADSGLDRVSMGGLIHQARWVDLSMRFAGT